MSRQLTPLRIVLIFALLSAAWILFSDLAVHKITQDAAVITRLSIVKGWIYVLITSIVLYLLVAAYARNRKNMSSILS